ncbi:hypothetical protein D3C75_856560 [compost metagenome]
MLQIARILHHLLKLGIHLSLERVPAGKTSACGLQQQLGNFRFTRNKLHAALFFVYHGSNGLRFVRIDLCHGSFGQIENGPCRFAVRKSPH